MKHFVSGRSLEGQYPGDAKTILFGMGCFWGAEKLFWPMDGVWVTAVGFGGGHTRNPSYRQICSEDTGHIELVKIVFQTSEIAIDQLLEKFWQGHDPTQGHRQGNDVGTQYRSAIFTDDHAYLKQALKSREHYQQRLAEAGYGAITTEIAESPEFYLAEAPHQQYLAKNPHGYCGLGGVGIKFTG